MSRRAIGITLALLLLVAAAAAGVLLDPAARVIGWVNGEPFFEGRSATAWGRDLRSPDENHATEATKSLAAGKSESLPVCSWLLRKALEPQVRLRAADALGKMGPDAAPAGPDLVAALGDADALVRASTARVVGDLAPRVDGAVPALIEQFPEREAIRAVAKFKQNGAAAVPKLTSLTKHEDAAVRRQAVRTLGKIGMPALPALPDLIALTTGDPDAGVREQSAEAIGEIGPAAAAGIPDLARALADPAKMVRRDAVRSLGQMGPAARDVLDAVKALEQDPEEDVRDAAKKAARSINPMGK